MPAPTVQEVVVANAEVRWCSTSPKSATIAGRMMTEGTLSRKTKVRVSNGIVLHTGEIQDLKRFKDDVSEARQGYECGIPSRTSNELTEGDNIEGFEEKEISRRLDRCSEF
jgi:translation initiation factor IF-2